MPARPASTHLRVVRVLSSKGSCRRRAGRRGFGLCRAQLHKPRSLSSNTHSQLFLRYSSWRRCFGTGARCKLWIAGGHRALAAKSILSQPLKSRVHGRCVSLWLQENKVSVVAAQPVRSNPLLLPLQPEFWLFPAPGKCTCKAPSSARVAHVCGHTSWRLCCA